MIGKYEGREMHNRLRRGARAGGAVYRTAMRAQARARSDIPDTFARTRTKSSASMRGGIVTRVRPRSPLLNMFEGGAGAHEIAPGRLGVGGRKLMLSGKAGDRWRRSDFAASMPVRHPGMAARPFLAPVFATTTPAAKRAVAVTVFGDHAVGLLGLEPET